MKAGKGAKEDGRSNPGAKVNESPKDCRGPVNLTNRRSAGPTRDRKRRRHSRRMKTKRLQIAVTCALGLVATLTTVGTIPGRGPEGTPNRMATVVDRMASADAFGVWMISPAPGFEDRAFQSLSLERRQESPVMDARPVVDDDGLAFRLVEGALSTNPLPVEPIPGLTVRRPGGGLEASSSARKFGDTTPRLGGDAAHWRRNVEAWPVASVRVGEIAYSRAEALRRMEVGDGADQRGSFFGALVAAKLNAAAGVQGGPGAEVIAAAEAWWGAHGAEDVTPESPAWRITGEALRMALERRGRGGDRPALDAVNWTAR